jgi:hypothetical protein
MEERLREELSFLREELKELKKCQLHYFTLSVGGTGAVFGFLSKFDSGESLKGLILLAPLAILVPCWWTFFDKATTITRLVGFTRRVEYFLSYPPSYAAPDLHGVRKCFASIQERAGAEPRTRGHSLLAMLENFPVSLPADTPSILDH